MVLEQFEALPAALRSQPRWVLWGLPGKAAKRPYCCISGGPASVTEAKTWTDFDEALTGAELWEAKGLGFVLGEGIACVDFDHCFNDDGQLDDWAAGWVERLDSYTERSQSGQGLHVFVRGTLPAAIKSQKAELYSAGRYIAMTGDVFGGRREISDAQDALDALAQELRPAGARADVPAEVETLDDKTRQERLCAALEAVPALRQLWERTEHNGDESGQDMALAKELYRALRPCTAGDIVDAMTASPWVESKDKEHARKWARADYPLRTAKNAMQAVTADDAAAVEGFKSPAGPWDGFFTLSDLAAAELPPIRWAVPGLLPAGLALLVAAPKIGKSWLALDLCLAVASGGEWLGKKAVQGAALYLDLEDSPNRLQSRMQKLLDGFTPAPCSCTVRLNAPPLGQGLEALLEEWYTANQDGARLVVVDTFQRIRPEPTGKENAYAADYRTCAVLQRWAMQHGICLLLVHHTKKAIETADIFNSISGSTGIFGAADAVLTITKKQRFEDTAVLSMTGRDIDMEQLRVTFDKGLFRWRVLGPADAAESGQVVDCIEELCSAAPWEGTLSDLVDAILNMCPDADIPESGAGMGALLRRLAPELSRRGVTHNTKRTPNKRLHIFARLPVMPSQVSQVS